MRTLLVMPNYSFGGSYAISLGLMYLSAYLKNRGFDVDCLNLNHYPADKLASVLREKRYDVIGTGGLFTFYAQCREVIRTVRLLSPDSKVVLGGAIASAHPEFVLESLEPDYLVLGEGELPMAGLLDALAQGRDPARVKGLALSKDGAFLRTGVGALVEDIDGLPWPDYEGFEFGRYIDSFAPIPDQLIVSRHKERRIAPIISGRGCTARCTFCYRLTPKFRLRSIKDVAEEVRYLVEQHRANEVWIWDDLFSVSKDRIREFCSRVKSLDVSWLCQLRVPVADEALLSEMKKAGCSLVSYGLESASPQVLKSMKKGIKVEQMENALLLTRKAGMTIHGNFIFGDPAETQETVEETLSFFRKHHLDFGPSLGLGPVVPYPGSDLYNDLVSRGRITNLRMFYEKFHDERGNPFNMTAMPDREWLRLVRKTLPAEEKAARVFGRVLKRETVSEDVYSVSYECPMCREVSDGLRVSVSPSFPVSSFRVTCPRCNQRSFVAKADLGLRHGAGFCGRWLLAGWWGWIKETPAFAAVRYHPEVDAQWNSFKERDAKRHLTDPRGRAFHELSFVEAVGARLRFAFELAGRLLGRSATDGRRP